MDFEDQIDLEHLLFFDRKCRSCNKVKNLLDEFYLTRKDRGSSPSAYSYECKQCTIRRIINGRKESKRTQESMYPDW